MTGTLTSEAAQEFLVRLTWERVENVVSEAEEQILCAAVKQSRFTNTSLVKATGKSKQNVTKYLNRLLDLHFVHSAERRGRHVYYEIAPDLALLRGRWPR